MSLPAADADAEALQELLEVIYHQYHHDFRAYTRPSLRRGIERAQAALRITSLAVLVERVAHEPAVFEVLLRYLTVQVSELFRDPNYFLAMRHQVFPHLATYPSIKIWVAGCSTGEEAYSLAILLHEEGLLERSQIYATDIDARSLSIAAEGGYGLERMRHFSESYFRAGGRGSLSDYYVATGSRAAFRPLLSERVSFLEHSLATDWVFAEVSLISCRNVFIYFDPTLRDRAIDLFRHSLRPRGFLGLGTKETLAFSPHRAAFESFASAERIYRLK